MKRTYRLRRPGQFHRVRRQGYTVSNRLFMLQATTNRRKAMRCGIIVTKRIGGAVQRNRAKRRVREAIRLVLDSIVPGMDIVVTVRTADVATIPFEQLQTSIVGLLHQARLWRDDIEPLTS